MPFFAPVRLTRVSTGQVLDLQATNLSENGLFLETVIPFVPGEIFRLSFPTEPGGFEEVAAARVAWRRPFTTNRPAAGSPPGTGIAFLMMHPQDREALRALVDAGGVKGSPARRPAPSHGLVQPKLLTVDGPAPRFALPQGTGAVQTVDVGPFGWLLVAALAAAAAASLVLGLQPVPV